MTTEERKQAEAEMEKKVTAWKKEHGALVLLDFSELDEAAVFICRLPKYLELKKASSNAGDEGETYNMVVGCILDPAPKEVMDIFEKRAGLYNSIAKVLLEKSGFTAEAGTIKNL